MQSVYTILLLIVSNIFMTCAWYGHLKMKQQFSGFDNQRKTLMPIVRCLQCLFKHVYNAHCKLLIMGIVKTLYDLLAQMCKYSFGLIRMEPCYFWVPFKPSHLLPGVDPGVSFDFLHGEV